VRLAYLLADVLGDSSTTGAAILGITPESFRARVARGRRSLQDEVTTLLAGNEAMLHEPSGETLRVRRAAAQLQALISVEPPPDLTTPDFVRRLRLAYPDLLGTGAP
jgi:hypothetical protein